MRRRSVLLCGTVIYERPIVFNAYPVFDSAVTLHWKDSIYKSYREVALCHPWVLQSGNWTNTTLDFLRLKEILRELEQDSGRADR